MMRWLRNTFVTAGIMFAIAVTLFTLATILSESIIRHYWSGDDDWLWLMLPLGGLVGLVLGLRYQHRLWMQLLSGALCVGIVALLAFTWVSIKSQPSGIATAVSIAIAVAMTQVMIVTAIVCLSIAIVTNAAAAGFSRLKHKLH